MSVSTAVWQSGLSFKQAQVRKLTLYCTCFVGVTEGVSWGELAAEAASFALPEFSGMAMKELLASTGPLETSTFASACIDTQTWYLHHSTPDSGDAALDYITCGSLQRMKPVFL